MARLDERRTRLKQVGQAIRSLLTLDDRESEFLQTELKDLHGQLRAERAKERGRPAEAR